ncbi:unnamed protein product [Angiostrongylus costaricensis]|uniref:Endo/exonuclease/phosphatase domain-containing protein n=1 Tax=Angiostrongylus costaricensis TaxID=334426 RepID=A0A0R3PVT3_ANGCS|nr:unnamed protein product [Angiostrongylus costaricensis]
MVTLCTYNARTLASESSIEELLMQARRIKYDVIGLAETRRRQLFNAVYDTGEEMFLGTCDSRGSRRRWRSRQHYKPKVLLTDVAVVPKFYTGPDHLLLCARLYFSRKGEKAAKFQNRSVGTIMNWDLSTY